MKSGMHNISPCARFSNNEYARAPTPGEYLLLCGTPRILWLSVNLLYLSILIVVEENLVVSESLLTHHCSTYLA